MERAEHEFFALLGRFLVDLLWEATPPRDRPALLVVGGLVLVGVAAAGLQGPPRPQAR